MTVEEKMEKITIYILNNIKKKITQEDAARVMGYGTNAFKKHFSDYFETSFGKFVKMLRMRYAAQDVYDSFKSLSSISEEYGYQSKQFFSVFRDEIGINPKQFQKTGTMIPDMPCKTKINGHPMWMEYKKMEPVTIQSYPQPVTDIDYKWLFCAYPFSHRTGIFDLSKPEKQYGILWHDIRSTNQMAYFLGTEVNKDEECPEGMQRISTMGGNYAVFTVERGADYYDIVQTMKALSWYVFRIWRVINKKKMVKMGFTYEAFDAEHIYLYIPLSSGVGGIELEKDRGKTVEQIALYVDENIQNELTVEKVAKHFDYSVYYCQDRFQACYNVSLEKYIRQKQLYLQAAMLKNNDITEQELCRKYHYSDISQFQKAFRREFRVRPEDYHMVNLELIDIKDYYSENFSQLKMSVQKMNEQFFAGKTIQSWEDKKYLNSDVTDLAGFWMIHDYPEMGDGDWSCNLNEGEKIALYAKKEMEGQSKNVYDYVLGPVMKEKDCKVPEKMCIYQIQGGKYAVFESLQEKDDPEKVPELIRLMVRCIDQVWIYDNWRRTDFQKRIAFLYYKNEKIYYYIPIK